MKIISFTSNNTQKMPHRHKLNETEIKVINNLQENKFLRLTYHVH